MDYSCYMEAALSLARRAAAEGEVPVGAVVVVDGIIVGSGYNRREGCQDPTGHAEMFALKEASRTLARWRLSGCTLVVTLEPCLMCMGAALLARVDRVVYGASDPKGGAAGSLYDVSRDSRLNHQIDVQPGVLRDECSDVLRQFFAERRLEHKKRRLDRPEAPDLGTILGESDSSPEKPS